MSFCVWDQKNVCLLKWIGIYFQCFESLRRIDNQYSLCLLECNSKSIRSRDLLVQRLLQIHCFIPIFSSSLCLTRLYVSRTLHLWVIQFVGMELLYDPLTSMWSFVKSPFYDWVLFLHLARGFFCHFKKHTLIFSTIFLISISYFCSSNLVPPNFWNTLFFSF